MIKLTRIMLFALVLLGTANSAMADRSIGKKSKSSARVTLNISTPATLKNSLSLNFRNGLKYTGSLLASPQVSGNSMLRNTLVTYQKGNTTYIIPYKQRIIMPDVKPGYTGMKLIIRQR